MVSVEEEDDRRDPELLESKAVGNVGEGMSQPRLRSTHGPQLFNASQVEALRHKPIEQGVSELGMALQGNLVLFLRLAKQVDVPGPGDLLAGIYRHRRDKRF